MLLATDAPFVFLFFMCLPVFGTIIVAKRKGRGLVKWGIFGLFFGLLGAICLDVAMQFNLEGYELSMVFASWMWVAFSIIPIATALFFPAIKYCPSCREAIREKAVACKHCGAGRSEMDGE